MISLTVVIFLVVTIIAYKLLTPKKRSINLPGPWGPPIIGNLLQMEPRFWRTFNKWSKEYGPLCKFRMGSKTTVLVSDHQIVKEMMALDAFSGRSIMPEFTLYEGQNIGLVNSEGEIWEQQRRFIVRQLRDLGFGKTSMESTIMEEVRGLIERLEAFNGKPVDSVKNVISLALVNCLWCIVAGTRYNQDDPKLRDLSYQVTGAFDEVSKKGAILAVAPWARHVIPELSGYKALRKVLNNLEQFMRKTITEHKETLQDDSPRDFIDVYLNEIKKTTDPKSSFYGGAAEKQLIAVIADLFQAATDTTATTLDWAILHLLKQPEIQRKLQAEIKAVTGNTRQVSFSDRPSMPYTQAVINELLRISIAPIGAPHRVLSDTEYRGVYFPKNTDIFINVHYIHHDPNVWENPDSFQPERFLTGDDTQVIKNKYLNPFLVGRRECPGQALAKDSVFLFLTNLVQKFDIVPDPDSPEADLEPAESVIVQSQPYSVIFQKRTEV